MGTLVQALKPECLMRIRVSATFVLPLLDASPSALDFSVSKSTATGLACVDQTLVLTNVSPLPVSASLSCAAPFSFTSPSSLLLQPGTAGSVCVRYDPNGRQDSVSRVDRGRLIVRFVEHPHEEAVELRASVVFPNIVLSATAIDFGCIVNNTSAHSRVTLSNPGSLPVTYKWALGDEGSVPPAAQVSSHSFRFSSPRVFFSHSRSLTSFLLRAQSPRVAALLLMCSSTEPARVACRPWLSARSSTAHGASHSRSHSYSFLFLLPFPFVPHLPLTPDTCCTLRGWPRRRSSTLRVRPLR
jgi:hypothetical protein